MLNFELFELPDFSFLFEIPGFQDMIVDSEKLREYLYSPETLFQSKIDHEVRKINEFCEEKVVEVLESLSFVSRKLLSDNIDTPLQNLIHSEVQQVASEIKHLEDYVAYNYIEFGRIVKDRDKKV
mgnify:CR=1 FL=1